MVKVIVHIAKAIVAVVISLLCFSCGFDSLSGNGNVTSQNRTVTGTFNSVSVQEDLEVIIQQGPVQSVTVNADENFQEHIITEVKGNELKISTDTNIGSGTKKITVILPNVESLSTESSATINSQGSIKSDAMKLSASGGSSIKINVNGKNVECETNNGSHIEITGQVENLQVSASSGGNINAKALKAENVKADASKGGETTVNPTDKLSADASSGGKVFYVTTPEKLKKNASSGGVVSQL
jgi:hypothetical protein